jgi:alginate O-acetyltransferase complex protein AlgI
MLFSSIEFLFYFLPAFLLVYYTLPWRNLTLLVASLIFYAWGEPAFLPLMVLFIILNHAIGLRIEGAQQRQRWLVFGVAANLGLLAYFKYANFFVEQLDALALALGYTPYHWNPVLLPLGISFITFQAISYLVDVYRGDVPAQRSLLAFAMYKSMFPQLIAGPIVRYRLIVNKVRLRRIRLYRVYHGARMFLMGLGQKVLIANTMAVPTDQIFGLPAEQLPCGAAWLGITCYTLQIYFDFAGYSNMAIGLGHMLGFTFPRNFDLPYKSQSVTEFWRRWHMTLSSWFRDYLYIPLGGNRVSPLRTYFNLALVFLLCGLWHGAAWTFVVWGAYHGALLVLERLGWGQVLAGLWRPLRHAYLLLAVMLGWVIFRADTLPEALSYFAAMFGQGSAVAGMVPVERYLTGLVGVTLALGIVLSVVRLRLPRAVLHAPRGAASPVRLRTALGPNVAADLGLLAVLLLCGLSLASGTYNPFIYFRF